MLSTGVTVTNHTYLVPAIMDYNLMTKMTIMQVIRKRGESYNTSPWNFENK